MASGVPLFCALFANRESMKQSCWRTGLPPNMASLLLMLET